MYSIALFGLATRAMAQDTNAIQGVRGEAHGSVSQFGVFGVGARAEFAVVPEGLLGAHVTDELALSLGGDVFFAELNPSGYNGGLYLLPIAALQWNFYIGSRWSVFPEAGLAFNVGLVNTGWNGRKAFYFAPEVGIGARYHLESRNAVLLRASSPGGVQVGLTF